MRHLIYDVRVALRGFHRTPAFAVAVLVILGLGIGMAVAMFTTFQTVLIRRLPVTDQDRIAVLWTYHTPGVELAPPSTALADVRRTSRTMLGVAGVVHWGAVSSAFLDGDQTLGLNRAMVTATYFDVLDARPALGRLLHADDDAPGAQPVMVLSYGAWQSQFGGSPSVLGRRLLSPLTRDVYTIVGVAPAGLDYPAGAGCWTAIMPVFSGLQVLAVARLAPGASLEAARAEYASIVSHRQPDMRLRGAHAETFTTAVLGNVRPVVVALTTAVALLLLIACVNVGNLLLLRAASRARELAVRRALGASYGDVVRQLVIESALLAIAGGVVGAICAAGLLRVFVALAPPQLPRLSDVQLHGNVWAMTTGVTTVCVLLFGVLPALAAARVNLASPLRLDARTGSESRRRRRVRDWLVASQVALALLLLAGAGLLTRSLRRLEHVDLGFRADHLSIVSIEFDAARGAARDTLSGWAEQIERRMRALPGVTSVTPILFPPFLGTSLTHPQFDAEGQTPTDVAANPNIPIEIGGSEYFRTFDTKILRGRGFTDDDREGGEQVVVVSESVARRFWPGQDPLGKRIRVTPPASNRDAYQPHWFDWRTVIGVAPDTRFRALREASPMVFIPWRQMGWQGYFAIRSTGDAERSRAAMRRAVHEIDPTLVVFEVRSMDQLLSGPLAQPRLSALLLTVFGAVALVLAAVGLYGAMASAVREQTREIGIRVALGASSAAIRDSVLRHALVVSGVGATVGLIAALATTRLLESLLFEVSPIDPISLLGVSALLAVGVGVAAVVPARRATRVDPIAALRTE